MSQPTNPLDDAFEAIDSGLGTEYKQLKTARWEQNVVKQILRFYHLNWETAMRNDCEQKTGEGRLLFSSFMQFAVDFPMWLGFDKVPFTFDIRYTAMVSQGLKFHMLDRLMEVMANAPANWQEQELSCGFVFEMLTTKNRSATWIAHNRYRPAKRIACRYLVENPIGNYPGIYVIDNFTTFLESIQWAPPTTSP